tara:strand:+ start:1693 stop:2565 length:873 start_codon:yes stop_codon:yes gene_type:complete
MAEFRVVLQINALSRIITVDGKQQVISEAFWNANIQNQLFPFWTSDNDRLIYFNYFDDGSYGCEKKKFTYNRVSNEKKWITYDWKEPTNAQAKEIADGVRAKYFEYQDVEQEEIQDELYQQYGKWNKISWDGIRMVRNFLLDDCDWTQNSDNALDATTKAQWATYRTKLRAIPQDYTGQEADVVKFPYNPVYYAKWKVLEITAPSEADNNVMEVQKPNEAKAYLATDDQFGVFPDKSLNTWSRRITTEIANKYRLKNPEDVFKPADVQSQYATVEEEIAAILASIEANNT